MSGDAHHITAPPEDGAGARLSMVNALKDATLNLAKCSTSNAHATSTELGDKAETFAMKNAFGEHAKKLAVSSTKSMTGHLLGAAGVVEAIFAISRDSRRRRSSDHQSSQPRSGLRSRLRAQHGAQAESRCRAVEFLWLRRHQWLGYFPALHRLIPSFASWMFRRTFCASGGARSAALSGSIRQRRRRSAEPNQHSRCRAARCFVAGFQRAGGRGGVYSPGRGLSDCAGKTGGSPSAFQRRHDSCPSWAGGPCFSAMKRLKRSSPGCGCLARVCPGGHLPCARRVRSCTSGPLERFLP